MSFGGVGGEVNSFPTLTNGVESWLPFFPLISSVTCSHDHDMNTFPFRRYLNRGPDDQEEDLPGLEEYSVAEMDLNVLRRRTMAAAAERRLQNLRDPAPWCTEQSTTPSSEEALTEPFQSAPIWCSVTYSTIIKKYFKRDLWTVLGCLRKVALIVNGLYITWVQAEYLQHYIIRWVQSSIAPPSCATHCHHQLQWSFRICRVWAETGC